MDRSDSEYKTALHNQTNPDGQLAPSQLYTGHRLLKEKSQDDYRKENRQGTKRQGTKSPRL